MLKKKLYCDLRARLLGMLRRWAGTGRAGRAWVSRAGVGVGSWASGRAAGARGVERAGGLAAGARGARGRQARGSRRGRTRGPRLGRAGWLRAVHSAHFRSVLTRFFFLSHQMNIVHCKIKFFRKKNNIIKFK